METVTKIRTKIRRETIEDRGPAKVMPRGGRKTLGPYSRVLDSGALGRLIDGRSTEGRFLRDFEARMVKHCGGSPTITTMLLIRRLARVALRLELFDEKMLDGDLTDHDARVYGALHNTYLRLCLALGLSPAAPPAPSPAAPKEPELTPLQKLRAHLDKPKVTPA